MGCWYLCLVYRPLVCREEHCMPVFHSALEAQAHIAIVQNSSLEGGWLGDSGSQIVHSMKLNSNKLRRNNGKYFFLQHILNLWNSLPQDVVMTAPSLALKRDWTNSWKIMLSAASYHLELCASSSANSGAGDRSSCVLLLHFPQVTPVVTPVGSAQAVLCLGVRQLGLCLL